jgi:hypothetical protein
MSRPSRFRLPDRGAPEGAGGSRDICRSLLAAASGCGAMGVSGSMTTEACRAMPPAACAAAWGAAPAAKLPLWRCAPGCCWWCRLGLAAAALAAAGALPANPCGSAPCWLGASPAAAATSALDPAGGCGRGAGPATAAVPLSAPSLGGSASTAGAAARWAWRVTRPAAAGCCAARRSDRGCCRPGAKEAADCPSRRDARLSAATTRPSSCAAAASWSDAPGPASSSPAGAAAGLLLSPVPLGTAAAAAAKGLDNTCVHREVGAAAAAAARVAARLR